MHKSTTDTVWYGLYSSSYSSIAIRKRAALRTVAWSLVRQQGYMLLAQIEGAGPRGGGAGGRVRRRRAWRWVFFFSLLRLDDDLTAT